jgi:hypothetical protein
MVGVVALLVAAAGAALLVRRVRSLSREPITGPLPPLPEARVWAVVTAVNGRPIEPARSGARPAIQARTRVSMNRRA